MLNVRMLIALAVAMLLVSFAVQTVILWLCGRWLGFPRATWRRSSLTVLAIAAASIAIGSLQYAVDSLLLILLVLLGFLVAAYLLIRAMLGTSFGKSLVATGVWLVGHYAFALLLAMVVRHYLIESFVVPTGAMATTILGTHSDVTCENCGCRYPISMSDFAPGAPGGGGDREKQATCGNCRHVQTFRLEGLPDSGDRIVVDKTVFPHRWDVAVFWYPPSGQDLSRNRGGLPNQDRVAYVKRLVGLPGETLQFAGGDVFTNGKRLRKRPGEQEDLWFSRFDSRQKSKSTDRPTWKPQHSPSCWNVHDDVSFAADKRGEREELVFAMPIDSQLSYNAASQSMFDDPASAFPASDVRVRLHISDFAGSGEFGVSWSFGQASVLATLRGSGKTTLEVTNGPSADDTETTLSTSQPIAPGQVWTFAHRDGRAYIEQDGHVVASRIVGHENFEAALAQLPPADESIDRTDIQCRVALFAKICRVRFSQVALDTDVYYIPFSTGFSELTPGHEVHLGENDFFMLGDNSPRSADSRIWGPAKRQDMIGVVRAIFWPPGRWHVFP